MDYLESTLADHFVRLALIVQKVRNIEHNIVAYYTLSAILILVRKTATKNLNVTYSAFVFRRSRKMNERCQKTNQHPDQEPVAESSYAI